MLSTFLRQRAVAGRYVARCSTAAHTATTTAASPPDRPPRVAKDKSLPPQNIHDAISLIREQARARFVETVEIAVKLNVDPRKQAQNVKGIASLPRGLGKQIRVGAFCVGADIDLAKSAGADLAGAEDLIKIVQGGEIPFDRVVATPEIMTKLSRIGKVCVYNSISIICPLYPLVLLAIFLLKSQLLFFICLLLLLINQLTMHPYILILTPICHMSVSLSLLLCE
jgi:hypothetical protein